MDISVARSRELRRRSTDAEALLWKLLRDRRFDGLKFRRQHPCGPFFLDFYCPQRRLAIELDGGQHYEAQAQDYDRGRTAYLLRQGITVVRFPTDVIFRELPAVMECIAAALRDGPSP